MATRSEKDDSVRLCETLETIGISELMRRRFRSIGTFHEINRALSNIGKQIPKEPNVSAYIFGSTIEGTTVYDMFPDMDVLECDESLPVIDQLSTFCKVGLLLIKDPDTSSGYVKLQLVLYDLPLTNKLKAGKHMQSVFGDVLVEDKYGRLVLKNSLPIEVVRNARLEKHGPAKTFKSLNSVPLDNVSAYRCRSWPSVAKEWIERDRRYGWPKQSVIKHFITLGCFVVGVGHHDSTEQDLEWRLSFSLQERELMFGLNDVQHKCFVLLKFIKKEVITPTVGESITSYHCKTCLFYTIERNTLDIWKPENLFSCVKKCLQLLLKWTSDSYCPNYFIQAENMFDRRIKGRLRKQVIEILEKILSEDFEVLNKIKISKIDEHLQNKYLLQSLAKNSVDTVELYFLYKQFGLIDLTLHTIRFSLYKGLTKKIRQLPCDIIEGIKFVKELMKRFSNSVPITEHTVKDTQEVVDLMLPFLHTILASHMASYAMVCTDPTERTNYIRESEKYFKQGLSSDLTSGRLKYLTFLYFDGQYVECETQLKEYRNVDIITPVRNGYQDQKYFVADRVIREDLTVRDILRTYVHASVIFLPTEYPLIHEALQFEMFRSFGTPPNSLRDAFWYSQDWAVVDSKVYMYFLWYLLSTKMNKPVLDRFYVLFKLILCTFGHLNHRETAFNLISWICLQEGFIQHAIIYLIVSWKEIKIRGIMFYTGLEDDYFCHHNAAKWHMLLIVKRLLDNGVISSGRP